MSIVESAFNVVLPDAGDKTSDNLDEIKEEPQENLSSQQETTTNQIEESSQNNNTNTSESQLNQNTEQDIASSSTLNVDNKDQINGENEIPSSTQQPQGESGWGISASVFDSPQLNNSTSIQIDRYHTDNNINFTGDSNQTDVPYTPQNSADTIINISSFDKQRILRASSKKVKTNITKKKVNSFEVYANYVITENLRLCAKKIISQISDEGNINDFQCKEFREETCGCCKNQIVGFKFKKYMFWDSQDENENKFFCEECARYSEEPLVKIL